MKRLNLTLPILIFLAIASYAHGSNVMLKDVTGHSIPFDSLKGKWVLINYWASWCQPCVDEITELNRFYKNRKEKIALFAVNYEKLPLANQIALIKKYKINYPSLQSDPGPQLKLGRIHGVPATFVFNPKGEFSRALYGEQNSDSLNRALFD